MRKPDQIVSGIRKTGFTDEGGNERAQWTEIAVAFINQDTSLTVISPDRPTDWTITRIHIRNPRPKEEAPPEQPQPQAVPSVPSQARKWRAR